MDRTSVCIRQGTRRKASALHDTCSIDKADLQTHYEKHTMQLSTTLHKGASFMSCPTHLASSGRAMRSINMLNEERQRDKGNSAQQGWQHRSEQTESTKNRISTLEQRKQRDRRYLWAHQRSYPSASPLGVCHIAEAEMQTAYCEAKIQATSQLAIE